MYRSKRKSTEAIGEFRHFEFASDDSVVDSVNHDEQYEVLYKATKNLKPNERKIISWHFENGMTFHQITQNSTVYNIYRLELKK